MPRGVAATGYGESTCAPDFLSDSRAGDENCASADAFVQASAQSRKERLTKG